ncbi:hypothetical protein KUTeg_018147 [Tegillarca granosa]|uniref:Uncharacterized protein n=1 Tax=Tegillarca granosa TaxID=220873 RepID=A0ABQ9EGY5_TEGGR|nr:hypothetical protein KUTeg_018147 [Tegillarca granosa]
MYLCFVKDFVVVCICCLNIPTFHCVTNKPHHYCILMLSVYFYHIIYTGIYVYRKHVVKLSAMINLYELSIRIL